MQTHEGGSGDTQSVVEGENRGHCHDNGVNVHLKSNDGKTFLTDCCRFGTTFTSGLVNALRCNSFWYCKHLLNNDRLSLTWIPGWPGDSRKYHLGLYSHSG